MSFHFASVLAIVLLLTAASMDNVGVRSQPVVPPGRDCSCSTLCDDVITNGDSEKNLRACINAGFDLCGCRCSGGGGLLHASNEYNCGVCVDLLTTSPSNCPCDDTDSAGNSLFHIASAECNLEILGALIKAGCNVSAVNNDGDTPICLAAVPPEGGECGGFVKHLEMNGANISFVCGDGQQPCERTPNMITRETLRQLKAPNCPPQSG